MSNIDFIKTKRKEKKLKARKKWISTKKKKKRKIDEKWIDNKSVKCRTESKIEIKKMKEKCKKKKISRLFFQNLDNYSEHWTYSSSNSLWDTLTNHCSMVKTVIYKIEKAVKSIYYDQFFAKVNLKWMLCWPKSYAIRTSCSTCLS